jgi:hypothetical protein
MLAATFAGRASLVRCTDCAVYDAIAAEVRIGVEYVWAAGLPF